MCTYNGQDFLAYQFTSLVAQTHPPDEVVVIDDVSSDMTNAIIDDFVANAPFLVKVHRNTKRLGAAANFAQAVSLCAGDIIALCDQDDFWQPDKLSYIAAAFNNPSVGLVYCDADVVDRDLQPMGFTWWHRVKFDPMRIRGDNGLQAVLLKRSRIPGACMAFRASLKSALLPLPSGWMHDAWFSLVASAITHTVAIDHPLQLYRQHGGNAIGGRQRLLFDEIRDGLAIDREAYYQVELERWEAYAIRIDAICAPAFASRLATEKLAHVRRRSALPRVRLFRLPGVAAEICRGGYYRYARNWGSIALDLFVK